MPCEGVSHSNAYSQRQDQDDIYIGVATYNIGMDQNKLTKSDKICRTLNFVGNIIERSAKEATLDIMCLCTLGGHKQGLGHARLTPSDIYLFDPAIQEEKPRARDMQNYLIAYGLKPDSSVIPFGDAQLKQMPDASFCDCVMMVQRFSVVENGGTLIVGNQHICMPHGRKVKSDGQTRNLIDGLEFLEQLGCDAFLPQPVVLVLVGDCNFKKQEATNAINRARNRLAKTYVQESSKAWRIASSSHGMTGDIAFVKGADFTIQDLSWISNYTDRRKHYAFAVQIRMPRKRQLDKSTTNTGLLLPSIHQTPRVQLEPEPMHLHMEAHSKSSGSASMARSYPEVPVGFTLSSESSFWLNCDAAVSGSAMDPLTHELYQWWIERMDRNDNRSPRAALLSMAKLMFPKKIRTESNDDRLCSASLTGFEEGSDSTFDFELFALRNIKAIIDVREEWLKSEDHPLDYQIPDAPSGRLKFIDYCKQNFHAQEDQKKLQERDLKTMDRNGRTGPELVRFRKKSRFDAAMRKRGGKLDFWKIISFTGALSPELLTSLLQESDQGSQVPTPAVSPRAATTARKIYSRARKLDEQQKRDPGMCMNHSDEEWLCSYRDGSLRHWVHTKTRQSGCRVRRVLQQRCLPLLPSSSTSIELDTEDCAITPERWSPR